jgi:hypothetical protein
VVTLDRVPDEYIQLAEPKFSERADHRSGGAVYSQETLDTCHYLANVGSWPRVPGDIHPEGWLANFDDEYAEVAAQLLDSYTYMSDREFRQAIAATIKSLSAEFLLQPSGRAEVGADWRARLSKIVVSVPLGSAHDITSSGVACLRILKQMRFPEERLLVGDPLLSAITTAPEPVELVLVDDLTASGNQFVKYWKAPLAAGGSDETTLAALFDRGALSSVIYVPVVATTVALQWIADKAPAVRVRPANVIGPEYFASDDACRLVPPAQLAALRDLIESNHARTGNPLGPYGYGNLGLALSFEHGTPNNTLPILQPRPTGYDIDDWTYLRSM